MKGGGARRKTLSSDRPPPPPRDLGNDEKQHLNDAADRYEDDRDYEDQSGDLENDGDVNAEAERPKLAEGFYEIESVRSKRNRKGKITYLIKWRGWPETSNTWEPVENLMSCSDVIDAFEARLRARRLNTMRKNKRKHACDLQRRAKKRKEQPSSVSPSSSLSTRPPPPLPPPPPQHQQDSPAATYDVPAVKLRIIEEPLPNTSVNDPTCSKWAESNAKGMRNARKTKQSSENGSLLVSQESKETNELNLKLSELKGASSTAKENTNGGAVNIQEDRSGKGVSPSNGMNISDVIGQNSIWANRNGGAKRRKSGAVKRFKQDLDLAASKDGHDARDRLARGNGVVVDHRVQSFEQVGNCYGSMNVVDTSKSMYAVTKIIKPIEYSVSTLNDMQDVLVTFLVLRSDGKEVMVDNRYLKAHYPLLLINFYEEHIQYTSPSG